LSFVTEQIAEHTNGTIGALLNATFGNAPELLIAVAALRSGFYRVVQLAMLGSMLTNMIFVFGVSCIIGGLRWQIQDLRITSGNVSVGMLFVSTAGSLFPAALILSKQLKIDPNDPDLPTPVVVTFCRVNASVMMILYVCYLVFQLGTHKDEYTDASENLDGSNRYIRRRAERNLFCMAQGKRISDLCPNELTRTLSNEMEEIVDPAPKVKPKKRTVRKGKRRGKRRPRSNSDPFEASHDAVNLEPVVSFESLYSDDECHSDDEKGRVARSPRRGSKDWGDIEEAANEAAKIGILRRKTPSREESFSSAGSRLSAPPLSAGAVEMTPPRQNQPAEEEEERVINASDDECSVDFDLDDALLGAPSTVIQQKFHQQHGPLLSMRTGIAWLFVITVCISFLSDIIVDTIDGFAHRVGLSEVFTSMVIIPFFSNVAEQVSAFLFAYRNEMDLVIGVTIGSAIQIATFVLPGSVLIGMFLDRSMTLYFHGFETVCIFFGVVVVGSILQGGTTNWLVGVSKCPCCACTWVPCSLFNSTLPYSIFHISRLLSI